MIAASSNRKTTGCVSEFSCYTLRRMLSRLPLGCAVCVLLFSGVVAKAPPVIDAIPAASIPAGKSLTIPVTATSSNSRPLAYTVLSSTNRITVELHTNNPFWKMSVTQVAASNAPGAFQTSFRGGIATVTNIGDLTLMLFKDRAPRSVDAFIGLTSAGFFNSNTIFHRVIPGFMIQGGDPLTNGLGGPVFEWDNEFHPRSIFSGSGQLALANARKDDEGSQFFITSGAQRVLDNRYTLFGQLLRGSNVVSRVINTPTTSERPLADVIITRASIVTNTTDTVITLTGTNLVGVSGTIQVIADDGLVGGRVTNSFTATTVADGVNSPPILFPVAITNLVAPVNGRLTNFFGGVDLEGSPLYWWTLQYSSNATNTTSAATNGGFHVVIVPNSNYVGFVEYQIVVSSSPEWYFYYQFGFPQNSLPPFDWQYHRFAFGDTPISALGTNITARPLIGFTNQILATFTNGVPNSPSNNFTASVNWGDNSLSSAIIVTNTSGRKEIRGTHTYTNSGVYPIYITINSVGGAQTNVVSVATVQPSLSLTRSGTNNVLRWPAWAAEFRAQSHTNLANTNWVSLTNNIHLIGYENVLTNGSSTSNVFFRLRR
jgi:cyclophilin family peptidyl-prolyl cis-trans isomerase